ncbi:MAG: tetratricopeptide repeat protein [Anaerolineae bacterium]
MIGFEGARASAAGQYAESDGGKLYRYDVRLPCRSRFRVFVAFARSRDMFERANLPKRVLNATLNLGESYRIKGDFSRARQFFRAAFEQGIETQVFGTAAQAAANEGDMLISMANWEQARERHQKALELAPQEPNQANRLLIQSQSNQGLATCALRIDDASAAWKYAQEALRLAHEGDQSVMLGAAYRTMGEVLTVLGYTPEGAKIETPVETKDDAAATNESLGDPDLFFQLSIESFQKLQAEGEIARTIYVQGLSLARRGQKVTASRKFQQATLMFTRLGMRDDANKAAQAQMNV